MAEICLTEGQKDILSQKIERHVTIIARSNYPEEKKFQLIGRVVEMETKALFELQEVQRQKKEGLLGRASKD